jgi:hypothetical protein
MAAMFCIASRIMPRIIPVYCVPYYALCIVLSLRVGRYLAASTAGTT